MRILLDECVSAVTDAQLLARAQGKIDVSVTIDRGFEFEVNRRGLSFGIVIAHVKRNRVEHYRPLFPGLAAAAATVRPGEIVHVGHESVTERRR